MFVMIRKDPGGAPWTSEWRWQKHHCIPAAPMLHLWAKTQGPTLCPVPRTLAGTCRGFINTSWWGRKGQKEAESHTWHAQNCINYLCVIEERTCQVPDIQLAFAKAEYSAFFPLSPWEVSCYRSDQLILFCIGQAQGLWKLNRTQGQHYSVSIVAKPNIDLLGQLSHKVPTCPCEHRK